LSVARGRNYRKVVYSEEHWRLLRKYREEASRLLECLARNSFYAIIHGSVARGDIHSGSDIDIFIPAVVSHPILVEILYSCGERIFETKIVQATPNYVPKVYLILDPSESRIISYPLGSLTRSEREFYKWGGELDLDGLKKGERVPGVNKDLLLIIPNKDGHIEIPVIDNENYTAKIVGVTLETVRERVRVLTNRREKGRTGVFLEITIPGDRDLSDVVKRIARKNPFFRKRLSIL
jgi:predicted nucleotidyltransferase